MIRRYLMALRLGLVIADGAIATLVFLIASRVRYGDGEWMAIWDRLGIDIRIASVLFGIAWVAALWFEGLYKLRARWNLLTELIDIAKATLLVAAATLSALFVFKLQDVSRLFLLTLFGVQPLVTFAGRALLRASFGYLRRHGHNAHFMLVVGTGRLAQTFADRVEAKGRLGIRVIGHLAAEGEPPHRLTRPILGTLDEIAGVLHSQTVDEIAICLPPECAGLLEPVIRLAAGEGKTVRVPLDPLEGALPNAIEEEFEGMTVRSLVFDGQREVGLAVKRLVDVVGSTAGLVILSPLLLGTAIDIRIRDGPPVLFRQTRVGLQGRPFTMYKFRTMVPDAETHLDDVRHLNEREGPAFKAADDPRVTPLGRRLRRTSIDEVPQLWNVLVGKMSLVGPRPPLPGEVTEYDIWHRRRLSMKPGMTGLWQVEARHDPAFDRWVERDLSYIDSWSLRLDMEILFRTIPVVVARGGR